MRFAKECGRSGMIAVDTNIVVRLLTQDEEQQYNKILKLFQEQDIFIPDTAILETEWVLHFAYNFKPYECHISSPLGS